LKGNFEFVLGGGVQSNTDFSASNGSPIGSVTELPSPSFPGEPANSSGSVLMGCELRLFVPGYQPLTHTIAGPSDLGRMEVGTLLLRRIAGVQGSAISMTSLQVPNSARKEFDRGVKDAHSNRLNTAEEHFEKAVTQYDKYAAAWSELGTIYSTNKETEKAYQAFAKAIAADPHYIPPYLGLASLHLQDGKYYSVVETTEKALELDPDNALAGFLDALGHYNMNQLDAAEKSARQAEQGLHEKIPQLHALLANIFLRKQDYANAAIQMRAYLKEWPEGELADQMKAKLQQIDKSASDAETQSSPRRLLPEVLTQK